MESNIGISKDGYDKLVKDLSKPYAITKLIREQFEIDPKVDNLNCEILLDYNIKPKDILYLLPVDTLKEYCNSNNIVYRGKNIANAILSNYRQAENLYIENYSLIANNDIIGLKNNGIDDINKNNSGIAFEIATKAIFKKMNFNVNDELRKKINSNKEKADIIIELENNEIIIIECKSSKYDFSKFATVTRQINSYIKHYQKEGYTVKNSILITGNFSDDFINECDIFSDYTLTIIESDTLANIYEAFKSCKKKNFPLILFQQGLMKEKRTIDALNK